MSRRRDGPLTRSGGQSSNNIWLALVGASGATYQPITVPELPGAFPNHGLPAK